MGMARWPLQDALQDALRLAASSVSLDHLPQREATTIGVIPVKWGTPVNQSAQSPVIPVIPVIPAFPGTTIHT